MNIVILAAGQGKRMNSALPKVLHPLAGQPILAHVLATARQLKETSSVGAIVVVHGHGGEAVRAAFPQNDIEWALQAEQLGTGHAVRQAMPLLDPARPTLVLSGDVPLVEVSTLRHLMEAAKNNKTLAILTVTLGDATGYGRIVRDGQGRIVRIVEQKEANENERALREINTGIMVLPTGRLSGWLSALSNQNAQNEYYLTDVIAMAVREGGSVTSAAAQGEWEVLGINSKAQLAQVERLWQQRNARRLMEAGAMLADPARIDVRMNESLIGLACGRDVSIDVNCIFIGEVVLADGVQVGANCILDNTRVGAGTKIAAFSILEKTEIGAQASVGPYARLRVGTVLADTARVGNFVEVKNSRIGKGSKANHLAYVGDAEIGERVNIGAGVITCNYDGAYKYKTVIGDDVFIGSDSQLVAPVSIGAGATIGAGTTLTKDVEAGNLAVSRTPQRVKAGWVRPAKDSSVKS